MGEEIQQQNPVVSNTAVGVPGSASFEGVAFAIGLEMDDLGARLIIWPQNLPI
jgi:hypothetical protein